MSNQVLANIGFLLQTAGLLTLFPIGVGLALAYKWLIVVAMIIGKVEILTILAVLVPITIKKFKRKTIA